MLKVELHTHTADDPIDAIPHTTFELIDRAATLGYDALAITLHERQLDLPPFAPYAAERGVVLIPGIERTLKGATCCCSTTRAAQSRFGRSPTRHAQGARARPGRRAASVLSGVGLPARAIWSAMRICSTRSSATRCSSAALDFNRAAERFAARHGKPVVGNCDVHRLAQLGSTYSLVDAERDPDAICAAIAAGRVRVESRPLAWAEAARVMAAMILGRSLENRHCTKLSARHVHGH